MEEFDCGRVVEVLGRNVWIGGSMSLTKQGKRVIVSPVREE